MFLCIFNRNPKPRRVIVTPLCSSPAAVAYHRLVPRAETSTANMLPPSDSLTLQMWRTDDGAHLSSHWLLLLQVPKTYCNAETRLMLRLEPLRCIYLQSVGPQHDWLFAFQWKYGLKSPLQFPNTRSNVYDMQIKKMHARVISGSNTFFMITCFEGA